MREPSCEENSRRNAGTDPALRLVLVPTWPAWDQGREGILTYFFFGASCVSNTISPVNGVPVRGYSLGPCFCSQTHKGRYWTLVQYAWIARSVGRSQRGRPSKPSQGVCNGSRQTSDGGGTGGSQASSATWDRTAAKSACANRLEGVLPLTPDPSPRKRGEAGNAVAFCSPLPASGERGRG